MSIRCVVVLDFIDLFPLLLLALFLPGIKPLRKKGEMNENYLSLQTGNVLKGLFAVVVVFHHLSQETTGGLLLPQFGYVGYLAVSVFFFLSGYGLQKSNMASVHYKDRFLQKRLPKILLPYLAMTLLYWLYIAVGGTVYSVASVLRAIGKGDPIVSYSWYVICICYFYVAFWLFMLICGKWPGLMVLCTGIWCAAYAIICKQLNYGSWWFNSSHLLVLGVFWAAFEPQILCFVKKHYSLLLPLAVLISLITFAASAENMINLPLVMASAVAFVLSVLLLLLKIDLRSCIFSFLGKISLEIYLLHGFLMLILRSYIFYIENEFLWCVGVIVGSVLSAWIMHWFFSVIMKIPAAVRKR